MLHTKNDALGKIIRYKVRLVENGYSQVARVDFNETFVLVAKFIIIRCIFAIRTTMNWEILIAKYIRLRTNIVIVRSRDSN